MIGHTPEAEARRRETKRRHDLECQNWIPTDQPSWLTEDSCAKGIQPLLKGATLSQIASGIGSQFLMPLTSAEDEENRIRGTGKHGKKSMRAMMCGLEPCPPKAAGEDVPLST